ncbi:MAG TPA: PilX N-terminal domain-containing pilus assembly protein [Vicinamibacterales bacterium]|nr:PilX N-terminal domain-containing pilus assembly protein [Vicinamibacterales bacterium]
MNAAAARLDVIHLRDERLWDERLCEERLCEEQGAALLVVLMLMALMMALSLALILVTMAEERIAHNYRRGSEVLYAADAAMELLLPEIVTVPNWDDLLSGAIRSSFVDGPPSGRRELPDGNTIDLTQATNLVRCGKNTCSAADLTASVEGRPWGPNNPWWQLYAYGPLSGMLPASAMDLTAYVIVWVADDPAESDDDPLRDGLPPAGCDLENDSTCAAGNAGRGAIAMLAQAFGPDGTRRTTEVIVGRQRPGGEPGGPARVRLLSWQELR